MPGKESSRLTFCFCTTRVLLVCVDLSDAWNKKFQACESISDGIGKSASALVRAPLKQYQRDGGVGSALATAVRAAPVAAIAPASAAARAMHYAFLGVRNRSSHHLTLGAFFN